MSLNQIARDKNGRPLSEAFMVKAEINGNGPPRIIQATFEVIGEKMSTIKSLEGGYYVVDNSKITITHFK